MARGPEDEGDDIELTAPEPAAMRTISDGFSRDMVEGSKEAKTGRYREQQASLNPAERSLGYSAGAGCGGGGGAGAGVGVGEHGIVIQKDVRLSLPETCTGSILCLACSKDGGCLKTPVSMLLHMRLSGKKSLLEAGFGYVYWSDGDTDEGQQIRLIMATASKPANGSHTVFEAGPEKAAITMETVLYKEVERVPLYADIYYPPDVVATSNKRPLGKLSRS